MISIPILKKAANQGAWTVELLKRMVFSTNKELTVEEKTTLADHYMIIQKLDEVITDLEGVIDHCNHGLNNTEPEWWNLYKDEEISSPYCPYDAILELCHRLETLTLFPLNIIHYVQEVPRVERRSSEELDRLFGPALMKMDDKGEAFRTSIKERVDDVQERYLKRLEQTFGIDNYPYYIQEIKVIAVTQGDLNKILEIFK